MARNRGSPATSCYAPFQLQRKRGSASNPHQHQVLDQPSESRRHTVALHSSFQSDTIVTLPHHPTLNATRSDTNVPSKPLSPLPQEPNHKHSSHATVFVPEESTFASRGHQPFNIELMYKAHNV